MKLELDRWGKSIEHAEILVVGATIAGNTQAGEKHGAQRKTGRSGPRVGNSTEHGEIQGGQGHESLKIDRWGKT